MVPFCCKADFWPLERTRVDDPATSFLSRPGFFSGEEFLIAREVVGDNRLKPLRVEGNYPYFCTVPVPVPGSSRSPRFAPPVASRQPPIKAPAAGGLPGGGVAPENDFFFDRGVHVRSFPSSRRRQRLPAGEEPSRRETAPGRSSAEGIARAPAGAELPRRSAGDGRRRPGRRGGSLRGEPSPPCPFNESGASFQTGNPAGYLAAGVAPPSGAGTSKSFSRSGIFSKPGGGTGSPLRMTRARRSTVRSPSAEMLV